MSAEFKLRGGGSAHDTAPASTCSFARRYDGVRGQRPSSRTAFRAGQYTGGVRVLFLDIDGVLNRTAFHPGVSVGLRSWIEPELAQRLCEVIRVIKAEIVLASDWRRGRELEHLRDELRAAGIDGNLIGSTPILGGSRWREIEAWRVQHELTLEDIVIIDDGYDMGPLASRFVRISPLNGLDEIAVRAIVSLFP